MSPTISRFSLRSLLVFVFFGTILILPWGFPFSLFSDPFSAKWVWGYVLMSLSAIGVFLFSLKARVHLPKILLFAVAAFFLPYFFGTHLGNVEEKVLCYLGFCMIALFASASLGSLNDERFKLVLFLKVTSCWAMIGLVFLQYFGVVGLPSHPREFVYGATFINRNFLAEALTLGIIASLVLSVVWKKRSAKAMLFFSFFLGVLFLILLEARSALLGTLMSAGVVLFSNSKVTPFLKNLLRCSFLTSLVLVPFAVFQLFGSAGISEVDAVKSIQIRAVRWVNTIKMIKERPLGWGAGNFEHTYSLFDDGVLGPDIESSSRMLVRSPHNGLLELLVENGVAFAAILVGILIVIWWRSFEWRRRKEGLASSSAALFGIGVLSFSLAESMFLFPMETPVLFCYTAFAVGLVSNLDWRKTSVSRAHSVGFLVAFSFLSLMAFSKVFYLSGDLFGPQASRSSARIACNLFPGDTQHCLSLAFELASVGRTFEASKVLLIHLDRQPYHYAALSLLAEAQISLGVRTKESCQTIDRILALEPRSPNWMLKWSENCHKQ